MNNIDAMKAYYEAKAQGGIVPYFQPIVSVNDHQMLAGEVLCRIQLPEGGLITPYQFIPILEETGEICDLDWYMAERACQMALSTDVECDQQIKFSVNMFRRHAYEWDAAEHLLAIADRYMVDPERIIVEITEGYSVEDYLLNEMMESLREAGFSVALDDFGEGYATLGSLKEASFDAIKIDRSMVEGNFTKDNSGAIIQSIVKLANNLGVKVIGEGAETYEQLLFYIRCGCEYAQGNIFGIPISKECFLKMILDGGKRNTIDNPYSVGYYVDGRK